ncbi:hypothetical protein H3Z85_15930 [Chryseobacterium indologenes]|uniref:Uncharacterized protein n=2 Tax=Chryseobacterium indologenes TaxID=253 RepID=A0A5R9PNY6_CHRID|nr:MULTISPECIES: hypothetical protein [Chryseobacterium]ASE60618.1 hypothetical protein CEQ15_03380 [Chryseobacterium indologenes]ATN04733.1 hypothetical protein CRN76_04595 [Chryseobacterium indologenes]AYY86515.1 hypothetical protein EGX91_19165 [Chryseobacterium indologenes]AYZ36394.1 hypothetical protein EGY07_12860 [Chryseobacterium indologenes]AZB16376.1 hypothetical protein EG352_00530 [Chryseobacterium indologenes]
MAEYYAKSKNTLSFEVTRSEQLVGKLSYESWFTFNAVIEIANSQYQVEPKGFWGTTIELKEGEKVLLKFRMNWNGEIVVQTYFNGIKQGYLFKHRGIFKDSFVLTDQEGIELMVIKPHLQWNIMNYEYNFTTSDAFETFPDKEIVLINALHCANYYMSMMMPAVI